MSNPINGQNLLAGTRTGTGNRTAAGVTDATTTAAAGEPRSGKPDQDALSVSSQLSRLGELSKRLGQAPVVDAAKVAEIRQALSDGTLSIDAEKVAESMLAHERQKGS